MRVINIPQLSDEWFKLRIGNPGASQFDKIITSTGKPSTQATTLAYLMAGEKLIGEKVDTYTNAAMERGILLEDEARDYYEFITGKTVQQVGLCFPDNDDRYHCSPDGLIDDDGGLEIKCPTLPVHTEYLDKGNKLPAKYVAQVQGSLFITGREYWDFMSYHPNMDTLIVRVEPDLNVHVLVLEQGVFKSGFGVLVCAYFLVELSVVLVDADGEVLVHVVGVVVAAHLVHVELPVVPGLVLVVGDGYCVGAPEVGECGGVHVGEGEVGLSAYASDWAVVHN